MAAQLLQFRQLGTGHDNIVYDNTVNENLGYDNAGYLNIQYFNIKHDTFSTSSETYSYLSTLNIKGSLHHEHELRFKRNISYC